MTPMISGGAEPGSDDITGKGRPNLAPGCLKVYETGPNGIPENGGGDDELLGTAGTDASGNFSMMLNRELRPFDIIYLIDVCPPFSPADPLVGPLTAVVPPAPAPALSPALYELQRGSCTKLGVPALMLGAGLFLHAAQWLAAVRS